jgi:hypothetical protein
MANDEPPKSSETDDGRFEALLAASNKFCEAKGLSQDLVLDIYRTDSDWAFVLKVDALVETASKDIIRHALQLRVLGKTIGGLDEFVDALSMNGRTSVLNLLKAVGCPSEELGFITTIRRVRNLYAHKIEYAEISLVDLIKNHNEKANLIKHLSAIENYVEDDLLEMYQTDPKSLRFGILDSTMRVLFYAYHIAFKGAAASA